MNKTVLKRAIILCWAFLAVCFVAKILGGNWFEIVVKDERFIRIGAYIDGQKWLIIIICVITSFVGFQLYYLAVCRKKGFKPLINSLLLLYFIGVTIGKTYVGGNYYLIFDAVSYFIIPCVLIGKPCKKYFNVLIAFALYTGFQAISLMVKNMALNIFVDENLLIGLIFSIDIYVMLVLYYLHTLYSIREVK